MRETVAAAATGEGRPQPRPDRGALSIPGPKREEEERERERSCQQLVVPLPVGIKSPYDGAADRHSIQAAATENRSLWRKKPDMW